MLFSCSLIFYYNGEKRSTFSFRRSSLWMSANKFTLAVPLLVVSDALAHKNIRGRNIFFLPLIIYNIRISSSLLSLKLY
ncbi:uncharacterized protein J3R85_006813 [Psidium guajava]|nr:uncharacterized protein J3R85_006813 [Psidium guajava]